MSRGLLFAVFACCALHVAVGHAQPQPAEAETAETPAADPVLQRLEAMEARLQAQDAQIEAQRAELKEQRELLETQRGQLAEQDGEIDTLTQRADDAELAALDETAPVDEASPLKLYGFMDMGFDRFFFDHDDSSHIVLTLRNTNASSFVFGNVNLYVDANPVERWRSLFELRFTLAPNGEEKGLGATFTRQNTTTFDFSSPAMQAELRLGGLFIERAWSEWTFADWLRIRAGLWLNPFGIWNVDHGSPTLIALTLPTFVAGQMMPGRLLGLQALGAVHLGRLELGYRAHVSNGRTPLDYDLTDNKAVGGRLYLGRYADRADFVAGVSVYHGSYDDARKTLVESAQVGLEPTVSYDETVLGVDVSVEHEHVRLRMEAVLRWVEYEEGGREPVFAYGLAETYTADRMEADAYALLSYRTHMGLEPYIMFEIAQRSFVLPEILPGERLAPDAWGTLIPSAGLNYAVTPSTMIKLQVPWLMVYNTREALDVGSDKTGKVKWTHVTTVPIIFTRLVSSF